jgi:hypothetical protein
MVGLVYNVKYKVYLFGEISRTMPEWFYKILFFFFNFVSNIFVCIVVQL